MPITSDRTRLYYHDVPKIACTSLKILFWELENGRKFPHRTSTPTFFRRAMHHLGLPGAAGTPRIHATEGYQTRSWKASAAPPPGYETLVVLRDPVERLYSAWKNKARSRVFSARDELDDLTNEGLPHDPDLGTFIEMFDEYRQVSRPVRIHTNHYSWHLGPDIEYFDHVFTLQDMGSLIAFLATRAGTNLAMPHRNKSAKKERSDKLSKPQLNRLAKITEPDYLWLKGKYSLEQSLHRFL